MPINSDTEATSLDWIDSQHRAMVDRLLDWSHTNSGSFNVSGLELMHSKLIDAFAPLQAEVESLTVPPLTVVADDGSSNERPVGKVLRLRKRPQAPCRVLLCGHMDTVFAVDHAFQQCQYENDYRINGPGVADMKGGLLVMLTALQALERSPHANNLGWEVVINADEEIGSVGSAPVLHESALRNHLGLIYEPSMPDGTLAGARKGSGNFSLLVRGKAAHAGREHHLGRNAIAALAAAMTDLDNLNQQSDDITLNLGRIVGGGAVNVVPDLAICHFNIRTISHADQQLAQQWIERIVADINSRADYQAELHGTFNRPPKPMTEQQQKLFDLLSNCGESLNINIQHVATGGCCDGNNLLASGLPNIDTLGVRGGNIHSAQEYILLDSLTERAKLSALLLMRLASGRLSISN